jgi:hypothetical protein
MKTKAKTTVETYIQINNGVKTRQDMANDLGLSYTKLATIVARMRRNGQIKTLTSGYRSHTFGRKSPIETL